MIQNLAEVALGKHFIDKNYDENFGVLLSKWEEMYNDKNFDEFSKAMPGYAKTISHFVENKKYYSDRDDAWKTRKEGYETDNKQKQIE